MKNRRKKICDRQDVMHSLQKHVRIIAFFHITLLTFSAVILIAVISVLNGFFSEEIFQFVTIYTVLFIVDILLIIGMYKKNEGMLIPFMIVALIFIVFFFVTRNYWFHSLITMDLEWKSKDFVIKYMLWILLASIILGLQTYCFVIVAWFFNEVAWKNDYHWGDKPGYKHIRHFNV